MKPKPGRRRRAELAAAGRSAFYKPPTCFVRVAFGLARL
jgi:hypothetical protein